MVCGWHCGLLWVHTILRKNDPTRTNHVQEIIIKLGHIYIFRNPPPSLVPDEAGCEATAYSTQVHSLLGLCTETYYTICHSPWAMMGWMLVLFANRGGQREYKNLLHRSIYSKFIFPIIFHSIHSHNIHPIILWVSL